MPMFNVAWQTQARAGQRPAGEQVCDESVGEQRQIALRRLNAQGEAAWIIRLDRDALRLDYQATQGVLQYFRLADATLMPLPPEHPPARHFLVTSREAASPLRFSPGDAYISLSSGAARLADSPAIARFIHLRDYFNAKKMTHALLDHLLELAGADGFPEDVTALVVEAR